jgi:phosphopantothenoylcysteine decarboxylase/phosphopantothenate--cysteine ligase
MIRDKKILLGITGSIAAYKAALLVRLLIKEGALVKVVMTADATHFITPLTLATLSKNPVLTEFVKDETGVWNNHVELGLWADLMLIAPASANTLTKCANGLCDNLLTAVYLSARCPVFFAPAMDLDMYRHPAIRHNLDRLRSYGNQVIRAEHGELASGLVGEGRLAEPEHLVSALQDYFSQSGLLQGRQVLLTAGPTNEALDPVRFISNHSSGKMGYAIAEAAANRGARVILVSGPTALSVHHPAITLIRVQSAQEMYQATAQYFPQADVTILAAAVADYRPAAIANKKIKKTEDNFSLEMVRTVDIAATLGQQKTGQQLLVGFALETDNEWNNALGKLQRKNLDLIVLNSLNDAGAGFGHDTNRITVIDRNQQSHVFPLKSKKEAASDILQLITSKMYEKSLIQAQSKDQESGNPA